MNYSQPGPSRASGGFVYFSNEGEQNNDFIPFDSAGPSTSRGSLTPTPNYPEHTFKSPRTPLYNPPNFGYTNYHSPNPLPFSPTNHSSPYGPPGNKRKYPSPNWQQNKRGTNWHQNRGRGRHSGGHRDFQNQSRGQASGQTDNRGNCNANRWRGRGGNRNFQKQKPPIARFFHPSMVENPWAKLEKAYEEKMKLEAQSAST